MDMLIERFLSYVKMDTQAKRGTGVCPSSSGQLELGRKLVEELKTIGLADAEMDDNGYVMATLPSNTGKKAPVIGFIAHLDTSPDFPGAGVNPRVIEKYDGGEIILNKDKGIVLSPDESPEIRKYTGEDLIVTDGTTLLGADDKAGVAEIMTAMEYLSAHPEIKHGTIRVCFTPDEELDVQVGVLDVEKFGADFAYTVDGGEIGELEYENFNAASAKLTISGRSIHMGAAKNKMVNSILIAMEINSMIPAAEIPSHTEGREGFYHLGEITGSVETTTMIYDIREFDSRKFEDRKNRIKKVADYMNDMYGKGTVEVEITDHYYNMLDKIKPVMHIVDTARLAMEEVGVKPISRPIRGGTDGATFAWQGLPAPNIFTGGHNYHGRYEYVPVSSMHKAVEVIVKIAEIYGRN